MQRSMSTRASPCPSASIAVHMKMPVQVPASSWQCQGPAAFASLLGACGCVPQACQLACQTDVRCACVCVQVVHKGYAGPFLTSAMDLTVGGKGRCVVRGLSLLLSD